MALDYYKKRFASLRVDTKPYWPAATFHRAPYKPLLLLAIMDLLAEQAITANLIPYDTELLDAFDRYWVRIVGMERPGNPVMPFNHLRGDEFWHLVDTRGFEPDLRHVNRNEIFRQIKDQTLQARLDEELFTLLHHPASRAELRRVLIENWFSPQVRPLIAEVSHITTSSFEYSRELLQRSHGRFRLSEAPAADAAFVTEVRSTAFRRVVVEAYQHTCAICHVRLVTPEGRTAVAAAHIVPWSHSHNDDPRNGMALCGLHHWAFDQGLVAVSREYTIQVSSLVVPDGQATRPLFAFEQQPVVRPHNQALWPAQAALRWHRENVFRIRDSERLL